MGICFHENVVRMSFLHDVIARSSNWVNDVFLHLVGESCAIDGVEYCGRNSGKRNTSRMVKFEIKCISISILWVLNPEPLDDHSYALLLTVLAKKGRIFLK